MNRTKTTQTQITTTQILKKRRIHLIVNIAIKYFQQDNQEIDINPNSVK